MLSYHNELLKKGCEWRPCYSFCLRTCHSGLSHAKLATVPTEPFSFPHSHARAAKNSDVSSLASSQVPHRPERSLVTLNIEQKHTELINGRSEMMSWLGSLFVIQKWNLYLINYATICNVKWTTISLLQSTHTSSIQVVPVHAMTIEGVEV